MNSKLNFKSRTMILLAGGLLSASGLIACVDEQDTSPQPVEHQSAHQALGANIQLAVDDLDQALGYLRSEAKFGVATAIGSLDQESMDCSTPVDPFDDDLNHDCEPTEAANAEEQLQQGADALVEELNARFFLESNIEEETDTKITYLVDGAAFCEEDGGEDCADNIDELQLRLAVTSPASGDIDIAVLLGEARYNPLDIELHRSKLAAEVDLGELLPTIELIGSIEGDIPEELPTLMQGRVRAELAHTASRASVRFDIQEQIIATGNDWSIQAAPAAPAARLSIDSAANTIEALLALKPVELQAPVTQTDVEWDAMTGMETETTTEFDVLAQLGGASFDLEYLVGDDRVELTNVGLGDTQSTLDIDGHRVLELDLNTATGRTFDVTFEAVGEDGADITVAPGFDLGMMIKFMEVQQHFDDLSDWMLDDMMRIALTGAPTPKVRVEDGQFKVLEGMLAMSSSAADIDVEVSAGQCLLGEDTVSEEVGGSEFDGDFGDEFGDEGSAQAHPFEGMNGGICE